MDPTTLPSSPLQLMSGLFDPLIEWVAAGATLPGQTVSGDRYVVVPDSDSVLIAVVDGLGHGDEAAAASDLAVDVLLAHATEPILSLFMLCHQALFKTRGVVMSLAQINARDNTLTWAGVGNVEGILCRADPKMHPARDSILLRGGIVGYQMPPLRASSVPIARGDVLVLVTDGIRGGFKDGWTLADETRQIGEYILRCHRKETDDAQVLVARYLGGTAFQGGTA